MESGWIAWGGTESVAWGGMELGQGAWGDMELGHEYCSDMESGLAILVGLEAVRGAWLRADGCGLPADSKLISPGIVWWG